MRLERFGQLNLAAVDGEILCLQGLGDVRRRDRAVQRLVLADAAGDGEVERLEPLAHGFGDLPLLGLLGLGLGAISLDLTLVLFGDGQRQLARKQVVARIPVGHLDDLTPVAEVLDVLSQNDFNGHGNSPLETQTRLASRGSSRASEGPARLTPQAQGRRPLSPSRTARARAVARA